LSIQIPSRLPKLVGPDQEKFNKRLRSEACGLGIGAFGYYRQVVENQKGRLIDEIIKVVNLEKDPVNSKQQSGRLSSPLPSKR